MEFYHLINRGVDKRSVVIDDHDRARFIHDLYAFNTSGLVLHPSQPSRHSESLRRKPLVTIHAYILMGNHYHLLVSEVAEHGVSLFMKRLNMGYARYFNERYSRTGALWQGKYRKVLVERDAHFMYIPYYIHLNALDYDMPEWRTGSVKKIKDALGILEAYRWSSHLDYLGTKNFPSLIYKKELEPLLGDRGMYERTIGEIISDPFRATESLSLELP